MRPFNCEMRRFICCVKRGNLKAGFSLRVMLKQAHISMATSGFVTEDQRAIFNAVSHRLLEDQGAEAIMLGGTDLALAFNEQTLNSRWSTVRRFMPMQLHSWRSLEELRPEPSVLVPHNRFRKRGSQVRRRRSSIEVVRLSLAGQRPLRSRAIRKLTDDEQTYRYLSVLDECMGDLLTIEKTQNALIERVAST
jgi:hypothetical protein